MELVGAGLDGGVDDSAIAAAKLSAVGVSLNLEFLQRLYGRLNDVIGLVQQIREIGIVVHAVQQKIVLQGARAIGRKAEPTFVPRAGLAGRRAGGQQRELSKIAAIERQIRHSLVVHHLA